MQYRNSTVTIGETSYKSREINMVEPEPPLFQLMGEKKKIEEVLSLQMVKELYINNTKALEKQRSKTIIESSFSYGSVIILLLLITGSITELLQRQKSAKSTSASIPETQEKPLHSGPILYWRLRTVAFKEGRVNTQNDIKIQTKVEVSIDAHPMPPIKFTRPKPHALSLHLLISDRGNAD